MSANQRDRQAELKQRFSQLWGGADSDPSPEAAVDGAQTAPEPPETPPAATTTTKPRKARTRRAEPVEAMPVAQRADTARPQRLMVPLSLDEDRALKELRLDDGVPAAARIRAMLQLYRTDQRFKRKVDDTVRHMR